MTEVSDVQEKNIGGIENIGGINMYRWYQVSSVIGGIAKLDQELRPARKKTWSPRFSIMVRYSGLCKLVSSIGKAIKALTKITVG